MRYGGFNRPYRGLAVSGDRFVVEPRNGGLLLAVIDGLGHGAESAIAALRAEETILAISNAPVEEIVLACHEALRPTRGAAIGLLHVDAQGQGAFCGIGNVEVIALAGVSPSLFCTAGIVGHNLRRCRSMPFEMKKGDVYCVLSDGVSTRGALKDCLPGAPADVAKRIVERHGRDHDDATALVFGYEADELLADAPRPRLGAFR